MHIDVSPPSSIGISKADKPAYGHRSARAPSPHGRATRVWRSALWLALPVEEELPHDVHPLVHFLDCPSAWRASPAPDPLTIPLPFNLAPKVGAGSLELV